MSLFPLSYWIATNSPLLILLEGGLDFFRHFTTSPLRLCALDVGRNFQAISVLTVTSLVGSTLGDTAKFKPFSSMVRWSIVKSVFDLLITHLLLSILFSYCCDCVLACLSATSLANLYSCLSLTAWKMLLARKEGWFKRKIREAIEIKTLQPTINRDQGFDLPAIYSEILPASVTRDRSRQTSGHPAQAIGAVASSSQMKETWRLRKLAFTSKKKLLKGNNFSTITMTESDNNIHAVSIRVFVLDQYYMKVDDLNVL